MALLFVPSGTPVVLRNSRPSVVSWSATLNHGCMLMADQLGVLDCYGRDIATRGTLAPPPPLFRPTSLGGPLSGKPPMRSDLDGYR